MCLGGHPLADAGPASDAQVHPIAVGWILRVAQLRAFVKTDARVDVICGGNDGIDCLRLVAEVALMDAEQMRKIRRQAKARESFQIGAAERAGEEGAAAMRFMEQGHAFAQGEFKRPFEQSSIFIKGEDVAARVARNEEGFVGDGMEVILPKRGEVFFGG